jgi:hypothetical protein
VTTYTNIFGGGIISPAIDSYTSYTLTAITQLVWPQETAPNSNLAAQLIEFAAGSTGGYGVILPSAQMVSQGQFLIFNNLSSYTQVVYSYGSAGIVCSVAPGAVYLA